MFWKLFRLQSLLDALFDDAWLGLGLDDPDTPDHETPAALQQA